MASTGIIRCPVCLSAQSVSKNISANSTIHCGNCKKDFRYANALPVGDVVNEPVKAGVPDNKKSVVRARGDNDLVAELALGLAGVILFFALVYPIRNYVHSMRGPQFIFTFIIIFFLIWFAVSVLRWMVGEYAAITLSGFAILEATGIYRYIDAKAAGMHNFGLLLIGMVIGGFLLFTRMSDFADRFKNDNCSGSGCGSSCSSCGGCGGCGG